MHCGTDVVMSAQAPHYSSRYMLHRNISYKHYGSAVTDKHCIWEGFKYKALMVYIRQCIIYIWRKMGLMLIPANYWMSNDSEAYQ